MCSIDALTLAPYLVPAFAGAFLVSSTLMCFMRRSYEQTLAKVGSRVTALEMQTQHQLQQQQQQRQVSYYPPVYSAIATAPPPSL